MNTKLHLSKKIAGGVVSLQLKQNKTLQKQQQNSKDTAQGDVMDGIQQDQHYIMQTWILRRVTLALWSVARLSRDPRRHLPSISASPRPFDLPARGAALLTDASLAAGPGVQSPPGSGAHPAVHIGHFRFVVG